jgi:hypothetical protein
MEGRTLMGNVMSNVACMQEAVENGCMDYEDVEEAETWTF